MGLKASYDVHAKKRLLMMSTTVYGNEKLHRWTYTKLVSGVWIKISVRGVFDLIAGACDSNP